MPGIIRLDMPIYRHARFVTQLPTTTYVARNCEEEAVMTIILHYLSGLLGSDAIVPNQNMKKGVYSHLSVPLTFSYFEEWFPTVSSRCTHSTCGCDVILVNSDLKTRI